MNAWLYLENTTCLPERLDDSSRKQQAVPITYVKKMTTVKDSATKSNSTMPPLPRSTLLQEKKKRKVVRPNSFTLTSPSKLAKEEPTLWKKKTVFIGGTKWWIVPHQGPLLLPRMLHWDKALLIKTMIARSGMRQTQPLLDCTCEARQ